MLLTISTTRSPATELGYLLHKNPARVHSFSQSYGKACVFYPEATEDRCTAALLVEIDPVALVRNKRRDGGPAGLLGQYVNDRPYAASSLLSVAIADVFGSALNGRCSDRPELVDESFALEFHLPALPVRGGPALLHSLFEPLGYRVIAQRLPLDERFPQWGDSWYYDVKLHVTATVRDALAHLYVLIPVLDNDKHYWVGESEVEKLLRHGEGWLSRHPEREAIVQRYLKHRRSLARLALDRLLEADGLEPETDLDDEKEVARADAREQALERGLSLNERRYAAVTGLLQANGASSVIDLGCGEGKLLRELLKVKSLTRVTGLDVSHRSLELAQTRLRVERMPKAVQEKLTLLHGSLMYRDKRLQGYDAATVVEVIEHLDTARLSAFERVLFEYARPRLVIVTTPNREYNVKFANLPANQLRHPDHRFEWTRGDFHNWSHAQCERFGYSVEHSEIGDADAALGAPTQSAVFSLAG